MLVHTQGKEVKNDIMEDINTSIDRIRPTDSLKSYIKKAKDLFDINNPHLMIDYLTLAYREMNRVADRNWRATKKNEIKNLIKAASGLFFETISNVEIASIGDEIKLNFDIINRSPYSIKLERLYYQIMSYQ